MENLTKKHITSVNEYEFEIERNYMFYIFEVTNSIVTHLSGATCVEERVPFKSLEEAESYAMTRIEFYENC